MRKIEVHGRAAWWRSCGSAIAIDVVAVAKRHKITAQTIYIWKKKFGAFDANEVRRLKQLEIENARLKKLVAERDLEIEVMKEIAAKKW